MQVKKVVPKLIDNYLNNITVDFNEESKKESDEIKFVDKQQQFDLNAEKILSERHKNKTREKRNEILTENALLRKLFSRNIFILICVWAFLILLIVFFQGFGFKCFVLSEKTLIILISTTTANIIALFVIVVKYLFHYEEDKTSSVTKKKKEK